MNIVDLEPSDDTAVEQAAGIVFEAFHDQWPLWMPDLETAKRMVKDRCSPGRISRVALDETGAVMGWIVGSREAEEETAWEVDPLAVRADRRGAGVGRALIADLEGEARRRGGITLWLGTDDDEANPTSLFDRDPYPDLLQSLAAIESPGGHPYKFYQRCGFSVAGLVPDTKGFGRHTIIMAKRIA